MNSHLLFAFLQLLSRVGKIAFQRDGRVDCAGGRGLPAVPKVMAGKWEKD